MGWDGRDLQCWLLWTELGEAIARGSLIPLRLAERRIGRVALKIESFGSKDESCSVGCGGFVGMAN